MVNAMLNPFSLRISDRLDANCLSLCEWLMKILLGITLSSMANHCFCFVSKIHKNIYQGFAFAMRICTRGVMQNDIHGAPAIREGMSHSFGKEM